MSLSDSQFRSFARPLVVALVAGLAACGTNTANNADANPADAAVVSVDGDACAQCGRDAARTDTSTGAPDASVTTDDASAGTTDDATPDTASDAATPPRDSATTDVRGDDPCTHCGDAAVAPMDVVSPPDDVPTPPDDTPVVPSDVPPSETGTPPGGFPGLPVLDSAVLAHIRPIISAGTAAGNRRDVFAKIGDSISESASFLQDCGNNFDDDLGNYTDIAPTIAYFQTEQFSSPDGMRNSLNRASRCAVGGWRAYQALLDTGSGVPLDVELETIHPMWAVVMYGTNDADNDSDPGYANYAATMGDIVTHIENHHVVPILSTIPERTDGGPATARVATINAVIVNLATTRHIPLMDYHAAMDPLPNHGISNDGIHPNAYMNSNACIFNADALTNGYNLRNLLVLESLRLVLTVE